MSYLNIPEFFSRKDPKVEITKPFNPEMKSVWLFIALGLFAGLIAGMFGKGGGLIIVPILIRFFRYEQKAATATSLAALQLPVGLPSVLVYAHDGYFNWLFAVIMAVGIVFGVFFGSNLAIRLPAKMFKRVYAIFLLGVAIFMVYKYL